MKKEDIVELIQRDDDAVQELLVVWESAVRETHHFLCERDMEELRPLVVAGLQGIDRLFCVLDEGGKRIAFAGIQEGKLEMLFVHPDSRSKGIGKSLVGYVIQYLEVQKVDVNEQNPQAIGFYEHLGFRISSRSELDGQGKPFPILHMKYCW